MGKKCFEYVNTYYDICVKITVWNSQVFPANFVGHTVLLKWLPNIASLMQNYDYRLEAKVTQHSSCSKAEKGAGGSSQSSENDGPSQMTALLESLKYQQEVVELERKVSALCQASLSAQL